MTSRAFSTSKTYPPCNKSVSFEGELNFESGPKSFGAKLVNKGEEGDRSFCSSLHKLCFNYYDFIKTFDRKISHIIIIVQNFLGYSWLLILLYEFNR